MPSTVLDCKIWQGPLSPLTVPLYLTCKNILKDNYIFYLKDFQFTSGYNRVKNFIATQFSVLFLVSLILFYFLLLN